jgi:hypothetical protein
MKEERERIIAIIEQMAIAELKEYEGKGDWGELKFKSRTSAVKHHRKERIFARIIARINQRPLSHKEGKE